MKQKYLSLTVKKDKADILFTQNSVILTTKQSALSLNLKISEEN